MNLWLPGATRVPGPHAAGGALVGGNALCTHHITVTNRGSFAGTRDYLVRMGYEPTLLLDPWDGGRAQFLPGNRSGYALEHPAGNPETNREGRVHVQIEWLWHDMRLDITQAPFFHGQWRDLVFWLDQLGVPRAWPFGGPLATGRDPVTWKKGGHRGHRNAPANTHVDSLATPHAPAWPLRVAALNPVRRAEVADLTRAFRARVNPLPARDLSALKDLVAAASAVIKLRP